MSDSDLAEEILRVSNGRRDRPNDFADPTSPTGCRANGSCGICDAPVPPCNGNLFYCNDHCRSLAYRWHHQGEGECGDPAP